MVLSDKMSSKVMDKYIHSYRYDKYDRRGLINLGKFAEECLQKRAKKRGIQTDAIRRTN